MRHTKDAVALWTIGQLLSERSNGALRKAFNVLSLLEPIALPLAGWRMICKLLGARQVVSADSLVGHLEVRQGFTPIVGCIVSRPLDENSLLDR